MDRKRVSYIIYPISQTDKSIDALVKYNSFELYREYGFHYLNTKHYKPAAEVEHLIDTNYK